MELGQKIPKPLNYAEKLEYRRERRELVFTYIGQAIDGAVSFLSDFEVEIHRIIRSINASLRAAGMNGKGLEVVKPRRQSMGLYLVVIGNVSVSSLTSNKKDTSLVINTLVRMGLELQEATWLARVIIKFNLNEWAVYQVHVANINTAIINLHKVKGLLKVSDWSELRSNWCQSALSAYYELTEELYVIDEQIDDIQFQINSIGGRHRGYKSLICRWPLNDEKYRYSKQVIIENPEIAYVAWNLGATRITRPISKIKGVGESGFITQRLIKFLRQRRNQKPLIFHGARFKELYLKRDKIVKKLEPTVNALQGAAK